MIYLFIEILDLINNNIIYYIIYQFDKNGFDKQ